MTMVMMPRSSDADADADVGERRDVDMVAEVDVDDGVDAAGEDVEVDKEDGAEGSET